MHSSACQFLGDCASFRKTLVSVKPGNVPSFSPDRSDRTFGVAPPRSPGKHVMELDSICDSSSDGI